MSPGTRRGADPVKVSPSANAATAQVRSQDTPPPRFVLAVATHLVTASSGRRPEALRLTRLAERSERDVLLRIAGAA